MPMVIIEPRSQWFWCFSRSFRAEFGESPGAAGERVTAAPTTGPRSATASELLRPSLQDAPPPEHGHASLQPT
ncbi:MULTISPECIES: hypothetical protein [unclassified Pseudonocardia]|uniref:hypothetical protein n=1 Tax=unclassified Pseudonocardia TaxID=2619320 RepID=UPI0001FFE696|nr:hypothetical protein [Pseudonocardia sp. Ae707_Ps1]